MRRTRFNNVVQLGVERQRAKLKEHSARHEWTRERRDYRVGLMICVDRAKLSPHEKAFCDAVHAIPPGGDVDMTVMAELYRLIGLLMKIPRNVSPQSMDLDEINDGGGSRRKVV